MTSPHLLIFALGGVQSFIAQARRTQDLWVGSRTLHIIGYKALETAVEQLAPYLTGARALRQVIVYPSLDADGNVPVMPNRFILIIPPELDPLEFANRVHAAAINAWVEISEATLQEFAGFAPADKNPPTWQQTWREQAGTKVGETAPYSPWLEFYWAAAPLDADLGNYQSAFRDASRLLAGRKHLRNFDHLPAQPGEKCTLNGTLSALSNDRNADRFEVRRFWESVLKNVNNSPKRSLAMLRRGERLCALNTIKRFAQDVTAYQDEQNFGKQRFPSTSTIAAAPFKWAVAQAWNDSLENAFGALNERLNEVGIKPIQDMGYQALQSATPVDYPQCAEFLNYDGDFTRAEGLIDEALLEYLGKEKHDLPQHAQQFEAIRRAFRGFKAAIPDTILAPSSYYAVLMLDGDHIGETIGGFSERDRHGEFSEALSTFAASKAGEVVEVLGAAVTYLPSTEDTPMPIVPGRLIYCGGDDILAMVPAESALPIAEALRFAFAQHMAEKGFPGLHMSGGIAITHFTHPLESALNAARHAEKHAKQVMGRDALTVTLMRRSGETRNASLRWEYNGVRSLELIDQTRRVFMQPDRLSSKLAYETLEVAELLDTEQKEIRDFREGMTEARHGEFLRLIQRHTANKKGRIGTRTSPPDQPDDRPTYVEANVKLGKELAALAEEISTLSMSGWDMLANWLLVVRFLAKGE